MEIGTQRDTITEKETRDRDKRNTVRDQKNKRSREAQTGVA